MKRKPKPVQETPFIPEFVSDEYFSTQSLKRAVWQYLIDHSKIVDHEGTIKFHFYMPNEYEFWRRVKARDENRFKRVDMADFQEQMRKKHKYVMNLQQIKNKYIDLISAERLKNYHISEAIKKATKFEKILLKIAEKMAQYSQKMQNKVIHKYSCK